ncbi:MAG: hypothetical protein QE570_03860 [Verrucomicrobiota bacterium]|jgi:hypothetical protein|nr:hypothetical protein [Verrucomicrobiota bacterium]
MSRRNLFGDLRGFFTAHAQSARRAAFGNRFAQSAAELREGLCRNFRPLDGRIGHRLSEGR